MILRALRCDKLKIQGQIMSNFPLSKTIKRDNTNMSCAWNNTLFIAARDGLLYPSAESINVYSLVVMKNLYSFMS